MTQNLDASVPDQALVNEAPAGLRPPGFDPSRIAAEAVNALDWPKVWSEARCRTMRDMCGEFYDTHLARTVADQLATYILEAAVAFPSKSGAWEKPDDPTDGDWIEPWFEAVELWPDGKDTLDALRGRVERHMRWLVRDSDGSGGAGETRSGSTESDSAGPKDIAQPPVSA